MRKKLALVASLTVVVALSAGVGAVVATTVINPSDEVLYQSASSGDVPGSFGQGLTISDFIITSHYASGCGYSDPSTSMTEGPATALTNRLGDVVSQIVIRVPSYDESTQGWSDAGAGFMCSRSGDVDTGWRWNSSTGAGTFAPATND